MPGTRVKGAASLRRLLRRLPDEVHKEIGDFWREVGQRQIEHARFETPRRTGGLMQALSVSVGVKTLSLRLGLLTKLRRKKFFYGYILDHGRRAKTVTIRRGPRAGHTMRITGISRERYNFVFGRRKDIKENEIPKLRAVVERALRRTARGAGDD